MIYNTATSTEELRIQYSKKFTNDILNTIFANDEKFQNYLNEKTNILKLTNVFRNNKNLPLKFYCIPESLKQTFENGHFHKNHEYYQTIMSVSMLYKEKNNVEFRQFINHLSNDVFYIKDLYSNKIIDKNNPNSILNFVIILYYYYKKIYKVHNQKYNKKFLEYFGYLGGDVFNLFSNNLFGNQEDMEFLSLFFIFAEKNNIEIDNLILLYRYYNYQISHYQISQNINSEILSQEGISFIHYVKNYIKLIFSHNYKNHTISHEDIGQIISTFNKWCDEYTMYILWNDHLSINLKFKFNKSEIIDEVRNFMLNDFSIVFHSFDYILYHYYTVYNNDIKNQLLLINEQELIKITDIVSKFCHFFEIFKKKKLYYYDIRIDLSEILKNCITQFNTKLLSIYMKNFSNSKNQMDNLQNELIDELSISIKDLYDEYFGKLDDYSKIDITDNELKDCYDKLSKMLNSDKYQNIELSNDERNIYDRFVDFCNKDKENPKINTSESIKYIRETLTNSKEDDSDLMIFHKSS